MRLKKVVRRNPLVLGLAVAALAVLLFISEGSYFRAAHTLDALREMAQARTSLQSLERGFIDAEAAQRGFLLTGRNEYLQPYDQALRHIEEAFAFLDRYYAGEAASLAQLKEMRKAADTRLSELALTIGLHRQGRGDTTRDIVLSDIGKEQMDRIRALGAELLARETRRVAQGRDDVYRTLMFSRIGIAVLSIVGLVALFLYLRKGVLLQEQQEEQQRLLQAERDRLELEVAQRTARLTELTRHLQTAREDERSRLARDLHDELGALLTSAKLDAARLRPRLSAVAPELMDRLAHLVDTLNSSIALGRRIIEDLRPSTLSNLGLQTTLEILAREFAERAGVRVQCDLQPVALGADAELVVYRVVQEAITNISKHAKARQVWITTAARDGQAEVTVRDDGAGFDTSATPASAYGLMGMRFRVEAEGGSLTLQSTRGAGTQVQVRLPQAAPQAA